MLLKTFEVKKEWVDYNNHMNMAYYVLVFDQAWEVALEKFKMGGTAAKDLNRSTMVVETNTKYLNEVKEGEVVNVNLTFFDHDKKRLHLKMEMISQKTNKLSASMERSGIHRPSNKALRLASGPLWNGLGDTVPSIKHYA